MKKLLAGYFLATVSFVVFSYLFIDPNLIYLKFIYTGFAFTNRFTTATIYSIFVFGFFAFYIYFLKIGSQGKIHQKTFNVFLAASCILIFSYPAILSYDIFNYLATSKVLYFYHENPYLVMPIEFRGDPMLLFTRATNKFALYGPTWLGLSAVPYFLGARNFIVALFMFKFLTTAFYLGATYIILKISKNFSSAIFFALNPLVLLEILVSGHNDIVMMFLALFSFYLLHKKKLAWSIVFIILSIFIKYATFFLLPVYLYYFCKQVHNQKIDWNRVLLLISGSMFLIFILSFIREEIYPWYSIWFMPFIALLEGHKNIKILVIALTLGLALYYIPYMFLGTYSFPAPILKVLFSCLPVVCVSLYLAVSEYGKSH